MITGADKVEVKTNPIMTRNDALANMAVALSALETHGDKPEVVKLATLVLRGVSSYFGAVDISSAFRDAEQSRAFVDLKSANKKLDAALTMCQARVDMAQDILVGIVRDWRDNGYLKVKHRDAAKAWLKPPSNKGKK